MNISDLDLGRGDLDFSRGATGRGYRGETVIASSLLLLLLLLMMMMMMMMMMVMMLLLYRSVWLNGLAFSALKSSSSGTRVRFTGRTTIPLGSNLVQVVYSHCLPSFSAPRNWGTKGSFRHLSDYGD